MAEPITIDPDLPYNREAILSGDPKRLEEYLLSLVKSLQDFRKESANVTNQLVQVTEGDTYVYYFGEQVDGVWPENTWRWYVEPVTNKFLAQYKSGTEWITKAELFPTIS